MEEKKQDVTPSFPTGTRELILAALVLLTGFALCNSILYGGFNLGFALYGCICLVLTCGYLLLTGCKLTGYSGALLALSFVILAGFARTDDGFVKFVLLCFLLISENLGLCLLAGQNQRSAGSVRSLLDAPRTLFVLGFGKIPQGVQGLIQAFRQGGTAAKKSGAVLVGLAVSIPLLAILIPLLISADAAFDSLMQLLPQWNITELIATVVVGFMPALMLYVRAVALKQVKPSEAAARSARKGISAVTVNTVLSVVAVLYGVYLLSQLAYFSGGFLGILPEGYTTAEYARRGFFEMAWLCAINLTVMILAVGLVSKEKGRPLSTRLLCLFIGAVTLFLVIAAGAKMVLYIGSFGLTRLRVLTSVIIFWLGMTTVIICLWLFVSKLQYMKAVLLSALILGAGVLWADVDTVVAHYNVSAYQSGALETVDVSYLASLGNSAVPYLETLSRCEDPQVSGSARSILNTWLEDPDFGYRAWNYVDHRASERISEWKAGLKKP